MKKIVSLICSIFLVLSMSCFSFGATNLESSVPADGLTALPDYEVTIDLSDTTAEGQMYTLFDGTIKLDEDTVDPAAVAVYSGYYKFHSWSGTKLNFGLGITCTHPILKRYKAKVEIYDANLLNNTLLSSKNVDFAHLGTGTVSLVDDLSMYTGSLKQVTIRVTNIYVTTSEGGPISRPAIGTLVKRP